MALIQFIILTLTAVSSAFLTYYLSHKRGFSPIRASALLALLVGGFFYFFPTLLSSVFTGKIPLYVLGGSFIGMVTMGVRISYYVLAISACVYSVLMLFMSSYFNGYGGAIGTMSCIALLFTLAMTLHIKNKSLRYGYRIVRVTYRKRRRVR